MGIGPTYTQPVVLHGHSKMDFEEMIYELSVYKNANLLKSICIVLTD